MITFHWLSPVVTPAVILWQESGENPALFCYLIGWGTYLNLRSRAIAPIPERVRLEVPCSNISDTCSITYLMSKG
jgi:hypothetical protein